MAITPADMASRRQAHMAPKSRVPVSAGNASAVANSLRNASASPVGLGRAASNAARKNMQQPAPPGQAVGKNRPPPTAEAIMPAGRQQMGMATMQQPDRNAVAANPGGYAQFQQNAANAGYNWAPQQGGVSGTAAYNPAGMDANMAANLASRQAAQTQMLQPAGMDANMYNKQAAQVSPKSRVQPSVSPKNRVPPQP